MSRLGDRGGTSSGAEGRLRYTRSSTVSVTQLLSDSCSSLIQKITSRVRGPSAGPIAQPLSVHVKEDETPRCLKPSAPRDEEVLERRRRSYYRSGVSNEKRPLRKREILQQKEEEELAGSVVVGRRRKSMVSSSQVHAEGGPAQGLLQKSQTSVVLSEKAYPFVSSVREKTPYGTRRKSGVSELKPIVVDIDDSDVDKERAAKRKEIQSLIMKYCNLEETSGESALAKCQQKYGNHSISSSRHRHHPLQQQRHLTQTVSLGPAILTLLDRLQLTLHCLSPSQQHAQLVEPT